MKINEKVVQGLLDLIGDIVNEKLIYEVINDEDVAYNKIAKILVAGSDVELLVLYYTPHPKDVVDQIANVHSEMFRAICDDIKSFLDPGLYAPYKAVYYENNTRKSLLSYLTEWKNGIFK